MPSYTPLAASYSALPGGTRESEASLPANPMAGMYQVLPFFSCFWDRNWYARAQSGSWREVSLPPFGSGITMDRTRNIQSL
jgi:hypothetical protein